MAHTSAVAGRRGGLRPVSGKPRRAARCAAAGGKGSASSSKSGYTVRRKSQHAPSKKGGSQGGKKPAQPARTTFISGCPAVRETEVLQPSASALTPWWSTFLGHSEGVWCGKLGSFNLADGKLEQVFVVGDQKLKEMHTHVIEQGLTVDGGDALQRLSYHAAEPITDLNDVDDKPTENLLRGDTGFLHFDGGSFSNSRENIGTQADMDRVNEIANMSDSELFGSDDEDEDGEGADPEADLAAALKDTNKTMRESTTSAESEYPGPADDVPPLDDTAEPEDIIKASEAEFERLEASVAANKAAEAQKRAKDEEAKRAAEEAEAKAREEAAAALSPEERKWREVARLEALEDAMRGEAETSTLEHCLAVSGQRRVRLQLLVQTRGGCDSDLDIDILRLTLFHETWLGESGGSSKAPPKQDVLADVPRPEPASLSGSFHRLELAAVPVRAESQESVDANDGEESAKAWFSREVGEEWAEGPPEPSEHGAIWWLPHGVTFSLDMPKDPKAVAAVQDGARTGTRRLIARTTWKADKFHSVMETEFAASGELTEARFSSLVPAENSIPSMNVPVAEPARV